MHTHKIHITYNFTYFFRYVVLLKKKLQFIAIKQYYYRINWYELYRRRRKNIMKII
jgi:hypothetical protein